MKTQFSCKCILSTTLFFFIFSFSQSIAQQGVAISSDGSSADPSAMLHVIAEHKGVLIPNLILNDTANADPVMEPAIGLLIYNGGGMEPHGFYYWDGNQWQPLLAGKLAILSDDDGDTRIEMDDGSDPDEIAFIIDTNETMRLDNKTLHLEAPGGSLFVGKNAGVNDDGTDNRNTFIGINAGESNTIGDLNTAIGWHALQSNTIGYSNIAIGNYALNNNTTGAYNYAIGTHVLQYNTTGRSNTAMGNGSLNRNTTGEHNTAIGDRALLFNTEGISNTAIGTGTLESNTTGESNTAIGSRSLNQNRIGDYNTAIGNNALAVNMGGKGNTAIGNSALLFNRRSFNTAIGNESLYSNSSGINNTAIGDSSLISSTNQSGLVAVGSKAGANDTSGTSNTYIGHRSGYYALSGSENTYLGDSTGYHNATGSRNTYIGKQAGFGSETGGDGDGNVAVGVLALSGIESGNDNVAIGDSALSFLAEANGIVAIGSQAGLSQTTGYGNTYIGTRAGKQNQIGQKNTFVGYEAGENHTIPIGHNAFFGYQAGKKNSLGTYNTFLGAEAGIKNSSGGDNTIVGAFSGYLNTIGENNTFIGRSAGQNNEIGDGNTYIGRCSGIGFELSEGGSKNTAVGRFSLRDIRVGVDNVAIGDSTGAKVEDGNENTFIGTSAGSNSIGNGNVFFGFKAGSNELGSNKLYIDNSDTFNPLIYGDFNSDKLTVHGKLGINTKTPDINVHITGTSDALLSSGTGMLMMGDLTGANLVMDNNEIMARNNGASSKLFMQYFGGDIQFGSGSGNPHLDIQGSLAVNSSVKKGKIFINGGSTSNPSIYMAGSPADIAYKTGQRLQIGQWDEAASWTTRMLFDIDGNIGIGTITPEERLHVNGNAQFDGPFAVQPVFDLWLDADNKLSINTSDARLKENVETLTDALDKVTQLRGVSYTWINSPDVGKRHGLIAQEVKEVIPDLVFQRDEYYGLNYSELSGFFVEAIKEQQKEIEYLKTENGQLKSALETLEQRLEKIEKHQFQN